MAGDEKHARELIAEARTDISDAERCQMLGVTPATGTLLRMLRKVTDALEAALPGDDDWELGYELRDAETGDAHCRGWEFATAEEARAFGQRRAAEENERWADDPDHQQTFVCVVVRRRLAGPWEPVEEVPRG